MVLPLSLLRSAQNCPTLVELKGGMTYNGHLKAVDGWMNICLQDVICTSREGDRFWRMPECYIRGTNIKTLRMPDDVIQTVKDEQVNMGGPGRGRGGFRGGRGGRGGDRGDRGGGRGGGGRGGRGGGPGRGGGGGGRGFR